MAIFQAEQVPLFTTERAVRLDDQFTQRPTMVPLIVQPGRYAEKPRTDYVPIVAIVGLLGLFALFGFLAFMKK